MYISVVGDDSMFDMHPDHKIAQPCYGFMHCNCTVSSLVSAVESGNSHVGLQVRLGLDTSELTK